MEFYLHTAYSVENYVFLNYVNYVLYIIMYFQYIFVRILSDKKKILLDEKLAKKLSGENIMKDMRNFQKEGNSGKSDYYSLMND